MTVRARIVALAVLAAVAGSASVGIAALARAGFCLHELGLFGLHDSPVPSPMTAPGMAINAMPMPMPGPVMHGGAECPALLWAAVVTGALYLIALAAIAALRPSPGELAVSSARVVVGMDFGPLSALLALAGCVPLGAVVVMDGPPGPTVVAAAALFLAVAAAFGAVALLGLARLVLAFARRLVGAIFAALRLLAPGGERVWHSPAAAVLVANGVQFARRRPSRAPPVRVQPLFTR